MEDNKFMEIVADWLSNKPAIFWFLIGLALMLNAVAYPFYLAGLKVKEIMRRDEN